ncbi:MAG TPA: sigma-70 family RNA polymerase sigma factor [Urbifossiella sp.]|nr:sigma-70 family RNA polymerase sigma factor [Urbifossiella sp.]
MYDEVHFRTGPGSAKQLQLARAVRSGQLLALIATWIPDPADQERAAEFRPGGDAVWPWTEVEFLTRVAEASGKLFPTKTRNQMSGGSPSNPIEAVMPTLTTSSGGSRMSATTVVSPRGPSAEVFDPASPSVVLLDYIRANPLTVVSKNHLMVLYERLLRGWLGRWCVPAHDVDDLVQDVLFEIAKSLPAFFALDPPRPFRAWVRVILAHRVHGYFRKKSFFARRHRPLVAELMAEDSQLVRLWDRDHDEFVVLRAWAVLERAVSLRDFQVFKLLVEGESSPAALRARFHLTPAAYWQLISRCRKVLRSQLEGLVPLD